MELGILELAQPSRSSDASLQLLVADEGHWEALVEIQEASSSDRHSRSTTSLERWRWGPSLGMSKVSEGPSRFGVFSREQGRTLG